MKKFLLLFTASLLLAACHEKDEAWYWNHPDALRKQLEQCAKQTARQGLSCTSLQAIAGKMQNFAWELQQSPQNFGKKILALQEKIALQEKNINIKDKANSEALEKDKQLLSQLLAVVKQYESPEG